MALQLQICTLKGQTLTLAASSTDTVSALAMRLRRACGDVTNTGPAFCLCHAKGDSFMPLDESMSLAALGVRDGARLFARRPQHAAGATFEATYETTAPAFLQQAVPTA
ncbi:unnamed protein product [Cladocopium goreaui]|uniref:Ubiquitin-like domain-containing protein n=1 Tax=Cladocopium goreaui TaxID=2562237 RepID=A0A9P1GRA9_9DINO|nr:unnamed protein product [Cladocopium goreaui]|mmetsp:Transcript_44272/g.96336  ORF Transcript_44272/g.96336 Transcript_44272/m.96336 type:complete len:109 (-) Transcript_44272:36-362(-)